MNENEVLLSERDAGRNARLVPTAKLHVLGLVSLKETLGPRWDRLSALVHKLFHTSLTRVQGPADSFIQLDELSYAVVFRSLSQPDVERVCEAVAREVCRALFGDQINEVSVRSVVAAIAVPNQLPDAESGAMIERMLECTGRETIVTQSVQSGADGPVVTVAGHALSLPQPPIQQIEAAHNLLAKERVRVGLFPVWDLQRNNSSSLFFAPFVESGERLGIAGRPAIGHLSPDAVEQVEIGLLNAASAYASRIALSQKVCAVGTGVSYATLSAFRSRIRYITALQKLQLSPSTPLVLKIEQIPEGTPASRIGELVALMRLPNIRLTLEFETARALPEFNFRLGVLGIGGGVPSDADNDMICRFVGRFVQIGAVQKAFAFIDRLETPEMVDTARANGARFGTGVGLGRHCLSGLEAIPDLPLTSVAALPALAQGARTPIQCHHSMSKGRPYSGAGTVPAGHASDSSGSPGADRGKASLPMAEELAVRRA
jgi:hypothetical protein